MSNAKQKENCPLGIGSHVRQLADISAEVVELRSESKTKKKNDKTK